MRISRMNKYCIAFIFTALITSAHAADMPIVYSLSKVAIHHAAQTPQVLELGVQVRDADSFYQQNGWFDVKSFKDGEGMLLLFAEPAQTPIEQASHYAPMDVLMVDETGTILSIAPSLVLAEMQGPIYPAQPVKAFLLLGGGSSERLLIQPGDTLAYAAFKKPPAVIDKPQPIPTPLVEEEKRLETPAQEVHVTDEEPASREVEDKSFGFEDLFAPSPTPPPRRKPAAQPKLP